MANEIYSTTLDDLAGLVSRQAADGMLQRALRTRDSDPDRVDVPTMSRLLRGDVRRRLERSLPRAGVRRHLAALDARLASLAVPEPARTEPHTPTPAPIPEAPTARGPRADARTSPPGGVLDRLGDQDAVRQWLWWPRTGTALGRGAGPPPERAHRLLAPALTALDLVGAVRSMHVDTGQGHVLIGRTPGATLTVAGDPDLNLGAIYAAFRALEEEP